MMKQDFVKHAANQSQLQSRKKLIVQHKSFADAKPFL